MVIRRGENAMTSRPPEATQQAADWVVQLRSPHRPANAEQDFADWLRASPLHVREYLRAVEVWEDLAHAAGGESKTREQLVMDATDSNLVEFPAAAAVNANAPQPLSRQHSRSRPALLAGALALLLTLAYVGWQHVTDLDMATGIGEQRSAVFADGSIVELNTQSEIRVSFSTAERRVELVRGEAFFQVSKDPARPFVVSTDSATAKAVGTRFGVYRTRTGTIVTVTEGRVLVLEKQRLADSSVGTADHVDAVEVAPGSQAEARPGLPVQMRRTNVERSLAWRDRRLIFDGESLASVVEEFNRYNTRPLIIADPRLHDQRISGVFGANDPESLLDFLVKVDHISVDRSDHSVIRIGDDAPP
jgi:transmembrane sensor